MTQTTGKRRGHGEDSIYWDASRNRYIGAVDLGFSPAGTRIRKKVSGRTKVEVRDKLRELHKELNIGLRPRRRYTVGDALEDWLAHGVDGLSARTVTLYRGTIVKALAEELGSVRLTELSAADVHRALTSLASRLSTRTVQIAHNVLVRAIRQAERDDLVGRNVAALVDAPKGQLGGRPSKSLTLEQAVALMAVARGTSLEAYVVLSLLSGVRTEEARALRWDHVVAWVGGQWEPVSSAGFDHEQVAVFVWRAERAGGDTKTPKSRRTLALPRKSVEALREQRVRQAKDRLSAGPLWKDHGLVFASTVGTPLDDHNVRRQFRVITEAAGLGTTWVPRELRHTFVSLVAHDLHVADLAVQHVLVEQDPEHGRVVAVEHCLTGEPSRYPLRHLLWGHVRMAFQHGPRVILDLEETRHYRVLECPQRDGLRLVGGELAQ